jgi:hypothetical protein
MTRNEKVLKHADYAARIKGMIESTGYFNDAVSRLDVRFGRPNVCKFTIKKGKLRDRLGKRGTMVSIPFDWEEKVYKLGFTILTEHDGGKVFCLDAEPIDTDLGVPVYYVEYVYFAAFSNAHKHHGWLVLFGGCKWLSDISATEAFRLACAAVERGLNGDDKDVELPF